LRPTEPLRIVFQPHGSQTEPAEEPTFRRVD
jgi:hypothetical protein